MTILPSAYLPSIEYFAALAKGDCVVDLGEHFVKRSERNRCRILAPNGVMELTAQVAHANRPRQPMRDMRLDYSKRWQKQHWGALVTAYKGSAYFDHYADRLARFYMQPFEWLVDYNMAQLEVLCNAAGIAMPRISETYIDAADDDFDLRPKQKNGPMFITEPYFQVFSDRFPFEPNLSFADLLVAEGPASGDLLGRCRYAE